MTETFPEALVPVMEKLRHCHAPGTMPYAKTYAWQIKTHYLNKNYDAAIAVADAMRRDRAVPRGSVFSLSQEYAGLAGFHSSKFYKAYHHLRLADQHLGSRGPEAHTNVLRSLAISLNYSFQHDEAEQVIGRALKIAQRTADEHTTLNLAELHLTASSITVSRLFSDRHEVQNLEDGRRHLLRVEELVAPLPDSTTREIRINILDHRARYLYASDRDNLDTALSKLDTILRLSQTHDMTWGTVVAHSIRARLFLYEDRNAEALDLLTEAVSLARNDNLNALLPRLLHYKTEAASKLGKSHLAVQTLKELGQMKSPKAPRQAQQASLKYASHLADTSTPPWTTLLLTLFGAGLLVGGGVVAGTHLARREDTWLSLPGTSFSLPPDSPPSKAPATDPADDGMASSEPVQDAKRGPESTGDESDAGASDGLERIDDGGGSAPDPVVRRDPSDASSLTATNPGMRNVPADDAHVPSADDRSAEHRRLLFALWGIPPYGTEAKVGLPAYLSGGTAAGYRSVTVDRIQRALQQRLFLHADDGTVRLYLSLRNAPSSPALHRAADGALSPTALPPEVDAVPLAAVDAVEMDFD